jgi:LSD1 subclass zinc finger protein
VPLVSCPKCATNLKIPDGASGNVKCPKCNTIFPVTKPAAAAFEVVEDTPPAPPPPPPAPKPAAKSEVLDPDFEVVDETKSKKGKKVVRIIEIDADDLDDLDDDDEDDRPKKKKKKKRRDYDDDDDWQPTGKGGSFGPARVGMLLVGISLWLYVGTFALLAFFLMIAWAGASIPNGLMILTGLLGLGNWIVALIGLGFCIAGPSQSRGLAIAATAVATVHLVMAFVVANNEKSINAGHAAIALASFSSTAEKIKSLGEKAMKETDPARRREYERELREYLDDRGGSVATSSRSEMRWPDLATLLPYPDILIAQLSYESRHFSDYVLGLLSGLVEVARVILIILLIGAVGHAARDRDVSDRSIYATIGFSIGMGVALIIWLIIRVITEESSKSATTASKSQFNWFIAGALLVYLVHLGTLVLPALLGMQAKSAAAYRAR